MSANFMSSHSKITRACVCVYTQMHALTSCSSRVPRELRTYIWRLILKRMSHGSAPDGLAVTQTLSCPSLAWPE